MSSALVDQLLEANKAHAASHQPYPPISEMKPTTIIISCADPRASPENIFQVKPGSTDIITFRTVAGHPQPVINDVIALTTVMAALIKQIIVLHHTDCGSTYWTDDQVKLALKERCCPAESEEGIDGRRYGSVQTSLEQNLREDLAWLKAMPLMPPTLAQSARAFMYDIHSGSLTEVQ